MSTNKRVNCDQGTSWCLRINTVLVTFLGQQQISATLPGGLLHQSFAVGVDKTVFRHLKCWMKTHWQLRLATLTIGWWWQPRHDLREKAEPVRVYVPSNTRLEQWVVCMFGCVRAYVCVHSHIIWILSVFLLYFNPWDHPCLNLCNPLRIFHQLWNYRFQPYPSSVVLSIPHPVQSTVITSLIA